MNNRKNHTKRTRILREPVMEFFEYGHLPDHLAQISKPFCELAHRVYEQQTPSLERTKALDLLLAAKDATVRAAISTRGDVGDK